jgi:hypothetical protein
MFACIFTGARTRTHTNEYSSFALFPRRLRLCLSHFSPPPFGMHLLILVCVNTYFKVIIHTHTHTRVCVCVRERERESVCLCDLSYAQSEDRSQATNLSTQSEIYRGYFLFLQEQIKDIIIITVTVTCQ